MAFGVFSFDHWIFKSLVGINMLFETIMRGDGMILVYLKKNDLFG